MFSTAIGLLCLLNCFCVSLDVSRILKSQVKFNFDLRIIKMNTKRSVPRGPKLNAVQRDYLIDYMSTNPDFTDGRFIGPMGNENASAMWAILAKDLNSKGPDKNIDQWKKVWTDIKSKSRLKVSAIKAAHNRTGNIERDGDLNLTDGDKKVLGVIGSVAVEGSLEVADPLPNSEQSLRKLIDGDESGLLDVTDDISIFQLCEIPSVRRISDNVRDKNLNKRHPTSVKEKSQITDIDAEAGPSSRPTSAERLGRSRSKRDGRLLELLDQQNGILKIIATNGTRRNELLEEIVALKKRKLALMEADGKQ